MTGHAARVSVAMALGMAAGQASAQWTVTNLHPAGASGSRALGTSGFLQAGYASVPGGQHACTWSGTAASWVDIHPPTQFASGAYGVSDTHQVGWSRPTPSGSDHAALWSGTSASWVEVTAAYPGFFYSSAVNATNGNQHVGVVTSGPTCCPLPYAFVWNGTLASPLTPAGYVASGAKGINGSQIAGFASITATSPGAFVWNNGVGVSLHPAGFVRSSATATSGTHQAGYAEQSNHYHASVWTGTAASWVDLHPAGASDSQAFAAAGSMQAGSVWIGGVSRASLWTGTAASLVDLHAFLPAGFTQSEATGMWTDGTTTLISGWGKNNGRDEALLWTSVPPCYANCDGSTTSPVLNVNDFTCFLNSFAAGSSAANCDASTTPPVLNVSDFVCFNNRYAAGCP